MSMIGADLSAMLGLGGKFEATGEAFAGRSADIVKRVESTVEQFQREMSSLKAEADSLGGEIRQQMASLKSRADAVVWTGDHRAKHDTVIAEIDADIEQVKVGIEMFSTEAQQVVEGELSGSLNELATGVTSYGTEARTSAAHFATAVKSQHDAIDSVMNG
jgi:uncharacterized protein YukE